MSHLKSFFALVNFIPSLMAESIFLSFSSIAIANLATSSTKFFGTTITPLLSAQIQSPALIRLRPEFGTLEIRICDTPLTLEKVVALTAYCQTLALYFLEESPVEITDDLYLAYAHNRFQASRYGFNGKISVQDEISPVVIHQDILKTLKKLSPYAKLLGNEAYFEYLQKNVSRLNNGTRKIKKAFKNLGGDINALANFQGQLWMHRKNC